MTRRWLFALALLAAAAIAARETSVFPILKSAVLLGKQPDNSFLVASNQLVRPWGQQALLKGRPTDLAVDRDERLVAVLNSNGVSLLDATGLAEVAQIRTTVTSYAGIAFRPGASEIWLSETGRSGGDAVAIIPIAGQKPGPIARIKLDGHAIPTGIAFTPDGRTAFVALNRSNTVAVIDPVKRTVLRQVPVGVAPFGVAYSAKRNAIYASNRGGRRPTPADTTAPSSGAEVVVSPKTGASSTGTLSVIDAATFAVKEVTVGLAPAGIALSPNEAQLAVANAHGDSVSVVDTARLAVTQVAVDAVPEGVLGSQPNALAWAPDGKSFYVAAGGNNAVQVFSLAGKKWKPVGGIPVGWFPTGIAVLRDGSLRVSNVKGVGNTLGPKGTKNTRNFEGSVLSFPRPDAGKLTAGMREVRAANSPRFEAAGGISNPESLGIRHVFLIVKENRTYDQVFGDMPKGNNDPNLVMYGRDVSPNHHALAEQFILFDNFYASGAISFEGHQWLMQGFVSDHVERGLISAARGYAWNMSDSLTVSPAGFFWQGGRKPIDVRIYGELSLPLRWDPSTQNAVDINEDQLLYWREYWTMYKENRWRDAVGHRSGVPIFQNIVQARFPPSSLRIPDQLRAESFLEDLAERQKSGNMPNLLLITLTSDHTQGTNPNSPTPKAMVADNDLALGRMVEAISRSRFWPQSLILVVEDDAQDGIDHVDGHRTVALAIGPHIRRGALDSNHYNQISMIRTIQAIFGIQPRTKFLQSARVMSSIFTATPDARPYKCLPTNIALDTMNAPVKALHGRRLWAAEQSRRMNWDEVDDVPTAVLNRILWWDAKGWDKAYPR
jgi:YVTN family beta-propeller protein